jgi:hypothetical protein
VQVWQNYLRGHEARGFLSGSLSGKWFRHTAEAQALLESREYGEPYEYE